MACYFPLNAYRGEPSGPRKTRPIFFKEVPNTEPIKLPCGQCIGCRLARARDWTLRMTHEASLHDDNCFLTLTYSDEKLPDDMSLSVRPLQLFLKKLRMKVQVKFKFFACGEYGDLWKRPHYHMNIFGWVPGDLVPLPGRRKYPLFRSDMVETTWGLGNCWIGRFDTKTASYVAGYVVKKLNGQLGALYGDCKPEFATMSRGGRYGKGLGYEWFIKYRNEVYPNDFVILNGKKVKPPKFYEGLEDDLAHDRLELIKELRIPSWDSPVMDEMRPGRLSVRHHVAKSRLSYFHREEF